MTLSLFAAFLALVVLIVLSIVLGCFFTVRTAEAESKALQGHGIANQRKAIIDGLQASIEQFHKSVQGVSTAEVMQLVMITQYFDMLKAIGESDRTNTLFLQHSPGAVKDLTQQFMEAMLGAEKAKR
jgi:hypothetical protein